MGRTGRIRNSPCPCGSGKRFKFCCRAAVADLEALFQHGRSLVEKGESAAGREVLLRVLAIDPASTPALNNLAMSWYIDGDFEKAARTCETVVRSLDPTNAFALGSLVHYYVLLGRFDDAAALGGLLETLPPSDEWGAYKICEALARLRRHESVARIAGEWLVRSREIRSSISFFLGVAEANLGWYDAAREHLAGARRDLAHGAMAKRHLRLLEAGGRPATVFGDWPYLGLEHWMTRKALERVLSDPGLAARSHGVAEVALALLEDGADREQTLSMLEAVDSPRSVEILEAIAGGSFGDDSFRLRALTILASKGAIDPETTREVLVRGKRQEVKVASFEVAEVPTPGPELSPETGDLMLRARQPMPRGGSRSRSSWDGARSPRPRRTWG